jgi:siroheme synthase-like protein
MNPEASKSARDRITPKCNVDHNVSYPCSYFPLFVNLRGKRCVVVGAGEIAAGKVDGLMRCGAEITVVSPRAVPYIQKAARGGKLAWLRRAFKAEDVDGAFLAIAATAAPRVNAAVFRACTERGVLCNAVDDPEHCDFIYPAVMRRGALQIAVSTGGRSPALAGRIRQDLEARFGPEWELLLERLGRERDEILHARLDGAERARRLRSAAAEVAQRLGAGERDGAGYESHDIRKSLISATPTR